MLLSIDPSLTCTGWALFDDEGVVDLGRISTSPKEQLLDRLQCLADGLQAPLTEVAGGHVVIEVPSGKVGKKLHGRNAAGLSVYGVAVGYVICTSKQLGHEPDLITEQQWTGSQPKRVRTAIVTGTCPAYATWVKKDRGGDIADAIGLGEWWRRIGRHL